MNKINLTNLNEQIQQFPGAKTFGEVVVENYDIIIDSINELYNNVDNFSFETPKTQEEYNNLFKVKKSVEEFQDKLKIFLEKLDNEKIKVLREKTNELIKILGRRNGTTQGQITYLINEYKQKEIDNILEVCFENVKSFVEYPRDLNIFLADCKKAIKGKSKFEEIQNVALQVADAYSDKLEISNINFEKNKQELEKYCKEIGYLLDDEFIKLDAKQIVLGVISLNQKQEQYLKMLEKQKKEIQDKIDEQKKGEVVNLNPNQNNLKVIDVTWFLQNGKCVGIIIAKDTILDTITAYVGVGNGDDDVKDIELILKWGQKTPKEVFEKIIKILE